MSERHAVFFVMYNRNSEQLELTKQAFASILAQDIGPLDVFMVNNGSTQPTWDWLRTVDIEQGEHRLFIRHSTYNVSPIKLANDYSAHIYRTHDKIMGAPNDCVLPSNCYSELAKVPRGIVSATQIDDTSQLVEIPKVDKPKAISTNTPMAVMMTRRWAYQAIVEAFGEFFDEGFQFYASDCDLALKMAACGIVGVQLDVCFWHYRSATLRLSNPTDRRNMEIQADADRSYFQRKHGFRVTDPEYGQRFADINYRGESKIWTPATLTDGLTEFIESKIGKTDV